MIAVVSHLCGTVGWVVSQVEPPSVLWPSVAHRLALGGKVGVLVQDARYSVPLDARYLEAGYLEGEELGYRYRGRGRGRHRRYPGHKPATTDRRTRSEVAGIRMQPYRSSSTCPAGKVVVGRHRPLVRRVQSAAEMPTRRQTRRCVVATASSDIFLGGLCVEILRFVRCPEARMAQMVATMLTRVQDFYAGSGAQRFAATCSTGGYTGVPR